MFPCHAPRHISRDTWHSSHTRSHTHNILDFGLCGVQLKSNKATKLSRLLYKTSHKTDQVFVKTWVFICKISFLGLTQAAWPRTFSGSENNLIWQKCFMQIYLHKKSLNFTDYSKVVDRRQQAVPTFLNYYSRHHKGWAESRGNSVFSCSAVYLPTQNKVWQIGMRVPPTAPTLTNVPCPEQVESDLNSTLVRLSQASHKLGEILARNELSRSYLILMRASHLGLTVLVSWKAICFS